MPARQPVNADIRAGLKSIVMISFRRTILLVLITAVLTGLSLSDMTAPAANAQGKLTYPELITALQTKLPNRSFQTRSELITWVMGQIRRRKIDKPLTKDREDDLRQAGATEELIEVIRANSPTPVVPTPTPTPQPVDLGELAGKAVNLVKPEYTEEARQARTMGSVKLALELDEAGKVLSVTRLTVLPNGLTERAIEAARRSTFRPAMRGGKAVKGNGVLTYTFKINLVDVPATFAAAEDLRSRRDCGKAETEYGRVLDVNSRHAQALFGRGMCRLMTAKYDLAASDMAAAAASDPKDAEAFFYLGVALDLTGDHDKALENYAAARRLRPVLGRRPAFDCLYIERSEMSPDQARSAANRIIDACSEAFKAAPEHLVSIVYFKRGIAYRMKGDYDRALADLEKALNLYPGFSAANTQRQVVYNTRGLEAFNKKDYRKAFDDVSLAIQADPKNPVPYINRCAIQLYAWKQYNEAISDCSKAIGLSTRSSSAYNHRGYAYEMINNRTEAIADYRKALDLDPQNQSARTNLNRLQPERPTMKDN